MSNRDEHPLQPGEIYHWTGDLMPERARCTICGHRSVGFVWGLSGHSGIFLCATHAEERKDMIKLDLLVNGV